jgi:hypothetical protein
MTFHFHCILDVTGQQTGLVDASKFGDFNITENCDKMWALSFNSFLSKDKLLNLISQSVSSVK